MSDQFNAAVLLLRVVCGITLALHGLNHARSLEGTGRWFASLGMKPGWLHARMSAYVEIVGGLLMVIGLLTPFAGASFVGVLLVAGITNHRKNGFFIFRPGEGYEYVLVLGTVGAAMGGIGAGEWSIDHALDWTYGDWGFAISLGLGVLAAVGLLVTFWRPEPSTK